MKYPRIIRWSLSDASRTLLVPSNHKFEVAHPTIFKARLKNRNLDGKLKIASSSRNGFYCVSFEEPHPIGDAELMIELEAGKHIYGRIRFVSSIPDLFSACSRDGLVLLTNGRGGMARIRVNLGDIHSKYDCILGANLHPTLPVGRHIFVKRVRVWLKVNDIILAQLGRDNLIEFESGPPARWYFVVKSPTGRMAALELIADMLDKRNTTVLRFTRLGKCNKTGINGDNDFPEGADLRLTVRVDIEDRNFHEETKCNGGADYHFSKNCHALENQIGFAFTPAPDRQLRVFADIGNYHHDAEWVWNIPHFIERSRGQESNGDAYSPGWFDLRLDKSASATIVLTAETDQSAVNETFVTVRQELNELALHRASPPAGDEFGQRLVVAMQQFVVRRDGGTAVIAGYPWFVDWGRDSLICARGLLAAGMADEVTGLLAVFGCFEEGGTLPNIIHGSDVSNRETSDAPLWYGLVCEEAAAVVGPKLYDTVVDQRGRTVAGVLSQIANSYTVGIPNGIHMDGASALVWSPSHFTWMDTNYPAGTPREGYPIEIQVLWIRLLRQLDHLGIKSKNEPWAALAERAERALVDLYWLEDRHDGISYFADLLIAQNNVPAHRGQADDALRSNYLLAVALDLIEGDRARKCVEAALRYLVVPGALRSLAPLPVSIPLPIHGRNGYLLNDPQHPYWPRYEGDEDTRRKPAYHNGTAWSWTFPMFCEALAKAWDFECDATEAAQAYLGSMGRLLTENCIGQIPEIVDGDFPHWQRGCDAQAWGVTETFRVWKLLHAKSGNKDGQSKQ